MSRLIFGGQVRIDSMGLAYQVTRGNRFLRFLDRYVGIPFIWVLGFFRKKGALSKRSKIGLLNTAAIGDTILISAVIRDLKEDIPEANIVFFVGPSNYAAALLIDGIEVRQVSISKPWKAIQKIREEQFDVWIDFGQWARLNALYSFFARAKYKIGFQASRQGRHFVYDACVKHQKIHELQNYRKLVGLIGVKGRNIPTLAVERREKKEKDVVLHLYGKGYRAQLREWPEERWIEFMQWLRKEGYKVWLTGGKEDRARCEKVKEKSGCEEIEIAAGKLSLRETAVLLSSSQAVISVDTGIMHLAAALGCPTIALHGPNPPERWGGVGPQVIALHGSSALKVKVAKREVATFVDLETEKKCSAKGCMEAIQVNHVLEAFQKLIS